MSIYVKVFTKLLKAWSDLFPQIDPQIDPILMHWTCYEMYFDPESIPDIQDQGLN